MRFGCHLFCCILCVPFGYRRNSSPCMQPNLLFIFEYPVSFLFIYCTVVVIWLSTFLASNCWARNYSESDSSRMNGSFECNWLVEKCAMDTHSVHVTSILINPNWTWNRWTFPLFYPEMLNLCMAREYGRLSVFLLTLMESPSRHTKSNYYHSVTGIYAMKWTNEWTQHE